MALKATEKKRPYAPPRVVSEVVRPLQLLTVTCGPGEPILCPDGFTCVADENDCPL